MDQLLCQRPATWGHQPADGFAGALPGVLSLVCRKAWSQQKATPGAALAVPFLIGLVDQEGRAEISLLDSELAEFQRGWKSRSGKKRLNSIMIPAVMLNQMAAKTGAVVRNFFMAGVK
jgi:hypothetical protein